MRIYTNWHFRTNNNLRSNISLKASYCNIFILDSLHIFESILWGLYTCIIWYKEFLNYLLKRNEIQFTKKHYRMLNSLENYFTFRYTQNLNAKRQFLKGVLRQLFLDPISLHKYVCVYFWSIIRSNMWCYQNFNNTSAFDQ